MADGVVKWFSDAKGFGFINIGKCPYQYGVISGDETHLIFSPKALSFGHLAQYSSKSSFIHIPAHCSRECIV